MTEDELTRTELIQVSLACSQYADLLGHKDSSYGELKRISTKARNLANERGDDR